MSDKIHDLNEYQLAKDLCRELPKIQSIFLEFQKQLSPFRHYTEGARIYNEIHESLVVTDLYLIKYKKILNSKGLK